MDDLRDRLDFANSIDAPNLWPEVRRRSTLSPAVAAPSTRRRMIAVVSAFVIAVLAVGFAVYAFRGPPELSTPGPSDATPDLRACAASGVNTFFHCPESRWARQVAVAAGYVVSGRTGSAYIVKGHGAGFYFWGYPASEETAGSDLTGYHVAEVLGRVRVYSDGVRFHWRVHGLFVWVSAGPNRSDRVTAVTIRPLVRSSANIPFADVTTQSTAGIDVTYPSDWFMHDGADLPLVSPSVAFVVGSWDFPTGGDCAPSAAVASIPRDGVLLWLIEYVSPDRPSDFERRPATFDLGSLKGPFECVGESAYVVLFRDSGRFFQAQIVLGPDAGAAGKLAAEQTLDSLVVSRSA